MTLFLDISTASCFVLLLCLFRLLANDSQTERESGGGGGKREKGLISLQNHGSPRTSVSAAQKLQTCRAGLRVVWLETICCPLKNLFWVRPCIQGMEAKSGTVLPQF